MGGYFFLSQPFVSKDAIKKNTTSLASKIYEIMAVVPVVYKIVVARFSTPLFSMSGIIG